jgi:predicted CoA-binding protein
MARIIEDEEGIAGVVKRARRVAVLGIKPQSQRSQPAFYVPQYLKTAGVEVIPVPVYFPELTEILGARVYRKLTEVPGQLDVVDVFRRPADVALHVDELIAAKPKAVWMQLGIRNDEVAAKLVAAGIDVVMDRCLMVDHRRYAASV